jgi:hypothetical protein
MLALAWLGIAVVLLVTSATAAFPRENAFLGLALAGWLYCATFERATLRELWREHRLPIASAALVVASMFATGWVLQATKPGRLYFPQPAQTGLLLCIAPLAVLLRRPLHLRIVTAALAALTLWHLLALPVEAMTGHKWSWHVPDLLPRPLGPLNYQASGLAWQAYYFPGLYLGAFYLAAGAIGEERVFGGPRFTPRTWLVASLAWALAVACVQSRSALAGALAASLLGFVAFGQRRNARWWLVVATVSLAGAALFWYLFSENKSGPGLRWVYLVEYLKRSFDAGWVWTGRGYTIHPDPSIQVPGWQYLHHSHNDIAQVFFAWGLPTLILYLLFWFALARLALRAWRQARYWPVLSLVAVGPNLLTDLGFHHFEKVAFIALLAGMLMANRETARCRSTVLAVGQGKRA